MTAQHEGRVAVVTGAANGIGLRIAQRLAEEGARVCVMDRDAAKAGAAVEAIRAAGGAATAWVVDLSSTEAIDGTWAELVAAQGAPAIVVNCAGFAAVEPAASFGLGNWRRTLDINLTAPMRLTQLAIEAMRPAGFGRIVNVSSVSAVRAGTGRLAYGTSKAALDAMTRQFAVEAAPHGITVNAVAPGPVQTGIAGDNHGGSTAEVYRRMIPMGRYGQVDEVAHAALFLASTGASYVTGHVLAVDGGFLAAGLIVPNLFD